MEPQLKALEPSLAEKPAALVREDQRDMRVLGASRTAFRTANGHSAGLATCGRRIARTAKVSASSRATPGR